ncbi:RluA family pseudouridine synthase [Treponema rectale]|uniref:Pseudouridine synthase n=1 Tax=Treponema rectale TaxID=744512 RepID=A0A840S9A3_9SPIR|nr:RluA family pseudouridine synthase [Treponema rectale]MBB5218257.1 23S rRNA pseudouridine1911/1915/1917 synthase [Treponema rectale]QOS40040.1 RluA family pseudouridine synthase [Treponema rectale]
MAGFSIKVPEDYSGAERLDKYVASLPDGMNRSKLKAGLCSITVNGRNQKISYKVKPRDEIYIQWEDNVPDDIEPENIPLDIIFENDDVLVINKKQGMVTHPAAGNWSGTLVNALLYYLGRQKIHQDKTSGGQEALVRCRPGIVHRLDKDTSGIIITAKNRDAEEFLSREFKSHRGIVKEYICICQGRPQFSTGIIKTGMIRDVRDRQRFKAVEELSQGKLAVSVYKCIACYGDYSLMKVRIKTGRTHQIRVHMRYLNCPVLGDPIYSKGDRLFPKATLMLHSRYLKIKLPGSNEPAVFKTETPERFKKVLAVLHKKYSKTILSD